MNTITTSKKLQGLSPTGGQNRLELYIPINTTISSQFLMAHN